MNTTTGARSDDDRQPAPSSSQRNGTATGRRRPSRRFVSWVVGVILALAGAATLSYVAWEYYATDIIAEHRQSDIRADLRARWQYPTVGDVLGTQGGAATLGSAEGLVRIPRFGSDYEVPLIEGVRDEDLSLGVGHFPGTGPGQIGNFSLTAHRVTDGKPFRRVADLRPGDTVIIETAQATFTYELDTSPDALVVPFTEGWVLDEVPVPPDGEAPPGMPDLNPIKSTTAVLTLTTCSELFHTDDRLVGFGHLVSTVSK